MGAGFLRSSILAGHRRGCCKLLLGIGCMAGFKLKGVVQVPRMLQECGSVGIGTLASLTGVRLQDTSLARDALYIAPPLSLR